MKPLLHAQHVARPDILCPLLFQFSSVSVVSDSLQRHGLQHTRLPCPSPTPRACSNSCSSSRLCHPIISSSVIPFSSHLRSFPVSGSFPVSQFFPSGGQSIGASASSEYSGLISFRIDRFDLLAVMHYNLYSIIYILLIVLSSEF